MAPATTFDFSAIPQTFNHLKLIVVAASSAAGGSDIIEVLLNNDNGGDYDNAEFFSASDSTTEFVVNVAEIVVFADGPRIAAALATANSAGMVEIDIPGYTLPFLKLVKALGGYVDAQKAAGDIGYYSAIGEWRNTAAVTDIKVTLGGGSEFVVGSAAYLYGVT